MATRTDLPSLEVGMPVTEGRVQRSVLTGPLSEGCVLVGLRGVFFSSLLQACQLRHLLVPTGCCVVLKVLRVGIQEALTLFRFGHLAMHESPPFSAGTARPQRPASR